MVEVKQLTAMTALTAATLGVLGSAACASDETPSDEPAEEQLDDQSRVDLDVSDGVETEVEDSGNLGFDEPDEG